MTRSNVVCLEARGAASVTAQRPARICWSSGIDGSRPCGRNSDVSSRAKAAFIVAKLTACSQGELPTMGTRTAPVGSFGWDKLGVGLGRPFVGAWASPATSECATGSCAPRVATDDPRELKPQTGVRQETSPACMLAPRWTSTRRANPAQPAWRSRSCRVPDGGLQCIS